MVSGPLLLHQYTSSSCAFSSFRQQVNTHDFKGPKGKIFRVYNSLKTDLVQGTETVSKHGHRCSKKTKKNPEMLLSSWFSSDSLLEMKTDAVMTQKMHTQRYTSVSDLSETEDGALVCTGRNAASADCKVNTADITCALCPSCVDPLCYKLFCKELQFWRITTTMLF